MSDLISRRALLDAIAKIDTSIIPSGWVKGYVDETIKETQRIIKTLPSTEPEIITIEEVANQLGCATIQSALYWFEFLKTLDSLGFAIVRKETR